MFVISKLRKVWYFVKMLLAYKSLHKSFFGVLPGGLFFSFLAGWCNSLVAVMVFVTVPTPAFMF